MISYITEFNSLHELIDNTANRKLSTIETENLKSSYYQIEDFGFLVLTSNEQFAETWYPTPDYIMPAGWFTLEIDGAIAGDFNGDGLEDLVIHPMLFPHILPRETRVDPIFLLQQEDGSFAIAKVTLPEKYMAYRMGVGDFNGDGIDDAVFSTMGKPVNRIENETESPLTVYGGKNVLVGIDFYEGLPLFQGPPNWQLGYKTGHSMAVGDFNGDGFSDWYSDHYVAYGSGNGFNAEVVTPNASAADGTAPWDSQWTWSNINAAVSADFNEDGFDDLIFSLMPQNDNGERNGGDLYLLLGSESGLKGGLDAIQLPRSSKLTDNIGTNFMVAADFNGDNHQDLILIEHGWITDSGDASNYYVKGQFKLFLGDGKGNLTEDTVSIIDPYAGSRTGEGNLFALDVNGDGWIDLVSSGYSPSLENIYGTGIQDSTTIFLNKQGILTYVPSNELAFVNRYQFEGEEGTKPYQSQNVGRMFPVDIGNDGLVDFIGFVDTPMHQWPQDQQVYTYAYISKAIAPLGRVIGDEYLIGTMGNDRIYGYEGNDIINGLAGNDYIDGGPGIDRLVVSGLPSQYSFSANTSSGVDGTLTGVDGVDTLTSIEYIRFGEFLGNGLFVTDLMPSQLVDPDGNGPRVSPAKELLQGISDLYIAYFNRSPDLEGLMYWFKELNNGSWTLSQVSSSFTQQPEYRAAYPAGSSNRDFVAQIYANLFDRVPDDEGWDYWTSDLDNGSPRDVFILTVINGAYAPTGGADDKALLNNKNAVSLYYTEQLVLFQTKDFDANISEVLNLVTKNPATVNQGLSIIDYVMDNPIALTGLIADLINTPHIWSDFLVI